MHTQAYIESTYFSIHNNSSTVTVWFNCRVRVNKKNLQKRHYRDGIKRKGDKIGMGYMKHG